MSRPDPLVAVAWLLVASLPGGCIASNVVAPRDRMVAAPDLDALPFVAAPELVLDGLYESVDLRGDAAQSLRRIYYHFAADGTYTAAALTERDGDLFFQSLRGTWRNSPDGLSLDGADPVRIERADDYVRLTAPTGTLVLQRQPWR